MVSRRYNGSINDIQEGIHNFWIGYHKILKYHSITNYSYKTLYDYLLQYNIYYPYLYNNTQLCAQLNFTFIVVYNIIILLLLYYKK